MRNEIDILIVGGGVAGAALAAVLAERGCGHGVAVVDPQLYGRLGSSELNGGGVRCTFAEPLNVQLSLRSTQYYQQHARRVQFHQRGYLWMYDRRLWETAESFLHDVRGHGLTVDEMTPAQARQRFPVLGDVSDLARVTFTPHDGRLSPHLLRMLYLETAGSGGVQLLDGWQVTAVEGSESPFAVTLTRVAADSAELALTAAAPQNQVRTIAVNRLVNAAGPWASRVAALYGRTLPVAAVPRQVFLLEHTGVDLEPMPFFIDHPQDLYFRHLERDGTNYTLVSWSDPAERSGIDFSYRGPAYYAEHVRPLLARRVPALADIEPSRGWAGHYELSPDKSAVVGAVPGRRGLFNLNGLSAHGVMQSRGLGEAMAEQLCTGGWPDGLNLDSLNESRFDTATHAVEPMYV